MGPDVKARTTGRPSILASGQLASTGELDAPGASQTTDPSKQQSSNGVPDALAARIGQNRRSESPELTRGSSLVGCHQRAAVPPRDAHPRQRCPGPAGQRPDR